MWQNILVFMLIALAGGFTLWRFYAKFSGKSSCCGGGCTCKGGSCGGSGRSASPGPKPKERTQSPLPCACACGKQ